MRLPWLAVFVVAGERRRRRPGREAPAGSSLRPLALGLDDLVEDELAALDAVPAVVRQGGVAVLVDRVLAQDRLTVLDLEEGVDDRLAVVALVTGVLDRLQRDAHRLVPVDRVRLGIRAVLRLVLLEEVLPGLRVELRVEGRVRDERLLLGLAADLRRERRLRDAVGTEQLGVR